MEHIAVFKLCLKQDCINRELSALCIKASQQDVVTNTEFKVGEAIISVSSKIVRTRCGGSYDNSRDCILRRICPRSKSCLIAEIHSLGTIEAILNSIGIRKIATPLRTSSLVTASHGQQQCKGAKASDEVSLVQHALKGKKSKKKGKYEESTTPWYLHSSHSILRPLKWQTPLSRPSPLWWMPFKMVLDVFFS